MKYITVLEFEIGKVFQYETMGKSWNPDSESIEYFLNSVGHNLSNCEWMIHEDGQVIHRDAEWTKFTK